MAKEAIMKNRYPGVCHYCSTHVEAGAGDYDPTIGTGRLSCSDVVSFSQPGSECDMPHSEWNANHHKFTATQLRYGHTCLRQYNAICDTAYTSVEEIRAIRHAEIKANKPTAEQVALVKAAMRDSDAAERKQRRAELASLKASNTCPRCMGAGGSDTWQATGWTCNRCHGTGKYAA
jgi:hypothetical protein